jgi:hypothetical protein
MAPAAGIPASETILAAFMKIYRASGYSPLIITATPRLAAAVLASLLLAVISASLPSAV